MSDYVFEFGLSTHFVNSDVTETFDLVDDLGFEEDELEGKSDDEIIGLLGEECENFIANNIDSWVKRV